MESTFRATPATLDLHEAIRRRAEEIYFRSGRVQGCDLENWAQAEREIRNEMEHTTRRTAVIVNINGVQYIGEYRAEAAEGYMPGEFDPGASVAVRFDGDQMFVKRPNGKELATTVVQKIG